MKKKSLVLMKQEFSPSEELLGDHLPSSRGIQDPDDNDGDDDDDADDDDDDDDDGNDDDGNYEYGNHDDSGGLLASISMLVPPISLTIFPRGVLVQIFLGSFSQFD